MKIGISIERDYHRIELDIRKRLSRAKAKELLDKEESYLDQYGFPYSKKNLLTHALRELVIKEDLAQFSEESGMCTLYLLSCERMTTKIDGTVAKSISRWYSFRISCSLG